MFDKNDLETLRLTTISDLKVVLYKYPSPSVTKRCSSCGCLLNSDNQISECPGCSTPMVEMNHYNGVDLIPEEELCFE